ncbi:MAG: hypothetical protein ABIQ09_13900 [Jatrophihabitantaceae bacterium]
MLEEQGIEFDVAAALDLLRGRQVAIWAAELFAVLPLPGVPETFTHDYRARVCSAYQHQLRPEPHAQELLDAVAVPYSIVSNAPGWKIRDGLQCAGLNASSAHQHVSAYDLQSWICLGSSLPHASAEQRRILLRRICDLLSPGGVLLVDHRNFDYIVDHQAMPPGRSVYAGNVKVSLVASDAASTTFGYQYSDGFYRTLTVESLGFVELRDDLRAAGFDRVDSFGDQRLISSADDSGFFFHRAVRTATD